MLSLLQDDEVKCKATLECGDEYRLEEGLIGDTDTAGNMAHPIAAHRPNRERTETHLAQRKRIILFLPAFFAVAMLAQLACGQSEPAKATATLQVVHSGTPIDVRSGKTMPDAYIVVQRERIVSVPQTAPPAGDAVVALTAFAGVPGLIDAHAHIRKPLR